jgi:hypothetical protein
MMMLLTASSMDSTASLVIVLFLGQIFQTLPDFEA